MTKLEKCLSYLQDMEWRFEPNSNGPDEYVCPAGCVEFIAGPKNTYKLNGFHNENCEFNFVINHLKSMIEKENPHDILKEIL